MYLLLLDKLHTPVGRDSGRGRLLDTTVPSQTARTLNVRVVQESMVVDLFRGSCSLEVLVVVMVWVHGSIEDKVIIRIRQQVPVTPARHCSNHHSPLATATTGAHSSLVHERVVIVDKGAHTLDGVDIVLVHALVHRVAEGDLRGLVAVVVEEDQVHKWNEERKVQVVREIHQAVATRHFGQDQGTTHSLSEATAEQDERVPVEGGLCRN